MTKTVFLSVLFFLLAISARNAYAARPDPGSIARTGRTNSPSLDIQSLLLSLGQGVQQAGTTAPTQTTVTPTNPDQGGQLAGGILNLASQLIGASSSTPGATVVPSTTPTTTSTPTATSTPTTTSTLPAFAQETLSIHNKYRALHGVPALTWSDDAASAAQAWANNCAFQHQQQSTYGENLAWGYSTITSAVDAFYAESQYYTYGEANPSNFEQVGHFTQLVWKSTTSVGCVLQACSQPFIVCRYSPPGNYVGQYAQNVFPPVSSSST